MCWCVTAMWQVRCSCSPKVQAAGNSMSTTSNRQPTKACCKQHQQDEQETEHLHRRNWKWTESHAFWSRPANVMLHCRSRRSADIDTVLPLPQGPLKANNGLPTLLEAPVGMVRPGLQASATRACSMRCIIPVLRSWAKARPTIETTTCSHHSSQSLSRVHLGRGGGGGVFGGEDILHMLSQGENAAFAAAAASVLQGLT